MKDKNSVKTDIRILRCPFCGTKPIIEKKMFFSQYVVRCGNPTCEIRPSTKMHGDLNEALKVWRERY